MAEVYSQDIGLQSGQLSVFATDDDDGRIVIGSDPFALILSPDDALSLSAHIGRAYRALRPTGPQ